MTSEPSVAVVIATRDRPEMLREAVASVLAQDYPGEIEVLVVFDHSTPDPSLAHSEPGRTVRVTTNERTPGLAGARNTGIDESEAQLIAFLDDDDLWRPGKLQPQVAALASVPEAVLATTGIEVEYAGERHVRVLDRTQVSFAELLRDRHTELHPSTFLLRRAGLARFGGVDEAVPGGFGEDYDFLLRAAKVHPILHVREPLATIRWGDQSFFFQRWPTMAEGLTWLLERHGEFETDRRGSARIRGQVAFARAAQGQRREAVRWAWSAARRNPTEPRVPLALAVAVGLLSPEQVMARLHRHGRGI